MRLAEQRRSAAGMLVLASLLCFFSAKASERYDCGDEGYCWLKDTTVDCILISISEQRLVVFGDHQIIGWSVVSTGRPGYPTPTGLFFVEEKDEYHHSNLYNNAPMPFFLRLTDGGVGMHAGELPGYPASHGCIRLPEGMARELYAHAWCGTFVQILEGPIDSVFTEKLERSVRVTRDSGTRRHGHKKAGGTHGTAGSLANNL